ncbi:MAG: hypothetical protein J5I47_12820 [Vicingus serpentipes]|nr:hypothetical protein [Vicingus serpentipes]
MFNITNFFDHPTRPGHTVFRFYEKERATAFQKLLEKENVWFEHDYHTENEKTIYFFGVKNGSLKVVNQCNYLTNAQFRKPLIPNSYFRWTIFVITTIIIVLAILGYVNQI